MLKEKLVYLDFLEKDYNKKQKIIAKDPILNFISDEVAINYCESLSCEYITIFEEDYPNCFKLLYNPPWVIYYLGNKNLLKKRNVGIIGSRKCTSYGKLAVEKIIQNIDNKVIISGFAYGIDKESHANALKFGLNTIAILGSGLDNIYPNHQNLVQKMISSNLIISEYPPNEKALPWHFPMRNRLIAALSQKLIIIEATPKSGSLITVEIALELNKEIYALPGSVFSLQSKGTNLLIEEGANILTLETKF